MEKNIGLPQIEMTCKENKIALIYKLRWNIETFFGWWKRHLISISPYCT